MVRLRRRAWRAACQAALSEGLHLVGREADGIRAPDQTAHAGAGRQVDRNSVLFEPAEHADVGEALGRAAAESNADLRALGIRILGM